MPRQLDLRDDGYVSRFCVSDHILDLLLRVKPSCGTPSPMYGVKFSPSSLWPLRADLGQLWYFLISIPPALIFGQVPVKLLNLYATSGRCTSLQTRPA